jgi:glycosidase
MPPDWFRDAVFYEVFVRAYADGNGDGIGDLPGLTSRLDYLLDLGVDTLWLSPIMPSPSHDHGYDVIDYLNIHPDYGTLDDFHALVNAAYQHGLRIIVELIPNHTSDQHPWFQASRNPRHPDHAAYRDWYAWSETNTGFAKDLGDRTLVDLITSETIAHTLQKPCRFVLDRYGYRWLSVV